VLYDVRVIGYGSFDLQQDTPPKEGDTLDMEGTACTVLSVLPGESPYDAIIDAERATDHGMAEVGPVDMEDDGDEGWAPVSTSSLRRSVSPAESSRLSGS